MTKNKEIELPPLTTNEKDLFEGIGPLLSGGSTNVVKKHIISQGISLEKAPNPIVFIESPKFLAGPELFPFQFKTLRNFFELLCPFCNDIERIRVVDDVPREDQVIFEYDLCPKCGYQKYSNPENLIFYNELVGCGGMRGSKSVLASMLSHSIVHEALCTENLSGKLGLVKGQTLEGAFIAVSATQAEETIWDHFMRFYEGSPWYQNYTSALKNIEKDSEDLRVGSLVKDESSKYIYFKDRNLLLRSLHSNSGSLAGMTRLFAIIDELSRFDLGESKRSANEVYRVMKNSLATITAAVNKSRKNGVYTVPDARMVSISSPIYAEDKTMRLLEEAKGQKRMYSFHAPTWEMNPNVTKEDLQPNFDADPLGAERDFGANPPGAENPLIRDKTIIDWCIDKDRENSFTIEEKHLDLNIKGIEFNYLAPILKNVKFHNLQQYVLHADPGRSQDSFCVVMSHMENDIVSIDGVIELRPIPKRNRQGLTARAIHFPSVTKLILDLCKKLSIKIVAYDRWNSIEQLDTLRDAGILAVSANLDRDDHMKFVESLKSRRISFPKKEHLFADPRIEKGMPVAKMLIELGALNDDGKHIPNHSPNGTNDIIQCVIGTHKLLVTPGKMIDQKKLVEEQRERQGGVRSRRSGRIVHLKRFV